LKQKNTENLDAAIEKLNSVFQAASEEMYNAANADGRSSAGQSESQNSENPQDEVTDVDFEEVNDKK